MNGSGEVANDTRGNQPTLGGWLPGKRMLRRGSFVIKPSCACP